MDKNTRVPPTDNNYEGLWPMFNHLNPFYVDFFYCLATISVLVCLINFNIYLYDELKANQFCLFLLVM